MLSHVQHAYSTQPKLCIAATGLVVLILVHVIFIMSESAVLDPRHFGIQPVGAADTTDYAVYFATAAGKISPWHDMALQPANAEADVFFMVNEIPRGYVLLRRFGAGEQ